MNLDTVWPALIGFASAFLVNILSYMYQKHQDRKFSLQSEKRRVYEGFFNVANDYYSALVIASLDKKKDAAVLQNGSQHYYDVQRHLSSLAYYGSSGVIQQCERFIDCLDIYRSHINQELSQRKLSRKAADIPSKSAARGLVRDARAKAIILARSDALGVSVKRAKGDLSDVSHAREVDVVL